MSGRLVLLVGGQRSGKSNWAARLAAEAPDVVVVTPSLPGDAELDERIARHRADRPPTWQTAETFDLATAIAAAPPGAVVIVDAIDTWLLAAMHDEGLWTDAAVAPLGADSRAAEARVLARVDELVAAARRHRGTVIVIAGQPGSGPVAIGAGMRRYVDLHGFACQRIGDAADEVDLVVAGRRLPLPRDRRGEAPASLPTPTSPPAAPPSAADGDLDGLLARVMPTDEDAATAAAARHDRLAKPPGSLGRLEALGVRLAGIAGRCPPPVPRHPALVVAVGDHGVHGRGVSRWPQALTGTVATAVCAGGAASAVLAGGVGANVTVLDVGCAGSLPDHPRLRRHRVRSGTRDLAVEPAMSRDEATAAILAGAATAADLVDVGADLLVTGEVGIANTTASAALTAALVGAAGADVAGAGAGSDRATIDRKAASVDRALARHGSDRDPLHTLASLGGLEHAALVGVILEGAARQVPVVLDGVTTLAASLVASRLAPHAGERIVAGHRSPEPAAALALDALALDPLLDLGLRLGEGTGGLLAVPLVQSAARVLAEMATLAEVAPPVT